ncbi:glycosyltransferase family 1 protein [Sphingobacterium ginsenosidimutans]|uniref:Glycosyltransferase family 1 protein n=1 Tax=Sphingobacterium ginsenosidimutans TaxID=687845 RepID=A0ABP7ZRF4_9SPHI
MRKIVISAVNLVEAGPLAILHDCLAYLSDLASKGEYHVIAIVHTKDKVNFPCIEYIETTWPKKRWINRLWYEYVSMKKISKAIGPVYLWFSLHDTSPSVIADRRAVYCHNAFPFYAWQLHDLVFAPKIVMFALFTKYIYRTNILRNNYVVVQQNWLRDAMQSFFGIPSNKLIVARPATADSALLKQSVSKKESTFSFIYAGSPNSHKNFEVLCKAVAILEQNKEPLNFKVYITVRGNENKYAKWLYQKWGKSDNIHFLGFLPKAVLSKYYECCHCLVFASKAESWGLPISEFANYNKYMILADLPYAHETAQGANQVAFFDPDDARQLARLMLACMQKNTTVFKPIAQHEINHPFTQSWTDMFELLLDDKITIKNKIK